MVVDPKTLLIEELGNGVSPMRDCCHRVEKFGAFIPKLNSIHCISVSPVDILIMQQSSKLIFYHDPKIEFWIIEKPSIFQSIKEKNDLVTVSDQEG